MVFLEGAACLVFEGLLCFLWLAAVVVGGDGGVVVGVAVVAVVAVAAVVGGRGGGLKIAIALEGVRPVLMMIAT